MATSELTQKPITITLPSEMAAKAEALAEQEGRSLRELFIEAFRAYQTSVFERWWKDLRQYADEHNPNGCTEEDIPRLIKEVRAEMAVEEAALKTAKAS